MALLTIPGKIFIAGEYSVIEGGQGLFAAVGPGYAFENTTEITAKSWVHAESPLGVYLGDLTETLHLKKVPNPMGLGLGSSTAELIAGVFSDLGRIPETKRIWAWYRELFPKASGGDLVVQLEAIKHHQAFFSYENGHADALEKPSLFSHIKVFQINADLKLKTHTDLEKPLPAIDRTKLNRTVQKLKAALIAGDLAGLSALGAYADEIHALGLETELAHSTRTTFQKVPGVISAKGCGAGLHDLFLVAHDPQRLDQAQLENVAREFGLKPLGTLQGLLW